MLSPEHVLINQQFRCSCLSLRVYTVRYKDRINVHIKICIHCLHSITILLAQYTVYNHLMVLWKFEFNYFRPDCCNVIRYGGQMQISLWQGSVGHHCIATKLAREIKGKRYITDRPSDHNSFYRKLLTNDVITIWWERSHYYLMTF